ncbi:MAG: PepSY domain-containing protein [Micavibrio aeruginosavorus]|uniref:PepSY domain-containing protein n=1 Tax=Micavibrio aeruginosavorus TaxID=349221 RepID=A0A7T5R476_9BACT|nr:MAG: PepSY domain-containing protein [Micavibrio aeruginosavorus]
MALAVPAVTLEQARAIALSQEPGEVIEVDKKSFSSGTVYEFEIRKDDGTVMEIEVDGGSGAIIERKIDRLGPDAKLPDALVSQAQAEDAAKKKIVEMKGNGARPAIKEVKYTLSDGKTAYEIDVKEGFTEYVVFVDATTGTVLSAEKED